MKCGEKKTWAEKGYPCRPKQPITKIAEAKTDNGKKGAALEATRKQYAGLGSN
jgi:hypothetical protein